MEDVENRIKTALACFSNSYNCSQSVLAAFCEDFGINKNTAFKIAAGFGGGFRCGEVCGAISGGVMVIGLKYGHYEEMDFKQKNLCYMKTLRFIENFKKKNNSIICCNLLGVNIWAEEYTEKSKAQELFKAVCPELIKSAIYSLYEILYQEEKLHGTEQ